VIADLFRLLHSAFRNAQARDEWRRFLLDQRSRMRCAAMALAAAGLLLLTWPTHPVLTVNHGPFTYTAVGTLVVAMMAYLAFIQGIRVSPAQGRFTAQQWAAYVPLAPGQFLRGAVLGRMLEPLFFLIVVLPVLLPASALEGIGMRHLAEALVALAFTALTGRMVTLALLLWAGHRPLWTVLGAHAAMWTLFLLGWVWKPASPLAAFFAGYMEEPGSGFPLAVPAAAFALFQAVLSAALYAACDFRVRMLRAKTRAVDKERTGALDATALRSM